MADETYTFRCTVCGWEVTVDTPELPEDFVCEVCGVAYGGYAEHNYVTETAYAANCQEKDVTTKYCTVCGKVVSTTEGGYGPHHYDYDEVTVLQEPTCTREGIFEVYCTECGESLNFTISATGHEDADGDGVCDDCGAVLNSSTDGTTTGTCDKCGRNHVGKDGGLFGYNGFICRIIAFFRMIAKLFGKN